MLPPFRRVRDAAAVAHRGSRSLGGVYLQGPAGMHTGDAYRSPLVIQSQGAARIHATQNTTG